jgi:SAM-dependent methyltransferase
VKDYYEARAREYDDWWLGEGRDRERERPGWFERTTRLLGVVASLSAVCTLDVACGTGFLTRHLHGAETAFDQSQTMVDVARKRYCTAEQLLEELGGAETLFAGTRFVAVRARR